MEPKLTIVFPCYNSELFIRDSFQTIDEYLNAKEDIQVLFIEDCGPDNTYQVLNELVNNSNNKAKYLVKKNPQNLGKGGTVKQGILNCSTELMVFADPDLAYNLSNIDSFFLHIKPNELLIANRMHKDTRYLIPPSFFRYIATRHLSSRIFNKIAQILLNPDIKDNQAGLKMFFIRDIKPLLALSKQNDFSFDLELLVMAQVNGIHIIGMPVNFKYDNEPSTVSFIKDSFRLFSSLLKIFIFKTFNYYKIQ